MAVTVRFAPSPTGFLHVGGVRTALFNWLFARHHSGRFLVRIENTDTSREVHAAAEQIVRSLAWLGLEPDEEPTFQLDRMAHHQETARALLETGDAYHDGGAIRLRTPSDGVIVWDDVVRGRVEVDNGTIEDLVILRSDGRPTYNFAAPLDDAASAITHVIRGEDHLSNTPKQLLVLQAIGGDRPIYAHLPNVHGPDGQKLSKRHGAVSVEEFRSAGYLADAVLNYLALLGWSLDEKTTVMSRSEIVRGFTLERVGSSPATFDHAKLRWLNGVHLRGQAQAAYGEALAAYLADIGFDGDAKLIRSSVPLVQEKLSTFAEYPDYCRFLFGPVEPDPAALVDAGPVLRGARDALRSVEPFAAPEIETALRAVADGLELKPRKALQPIRIALTGSKVSPGLFESIELLGRDESLARLAAAAA
ncbi:MAG: glutamate--tRNA ligase family protein [Actinomycetia bacterium]|nr:glutamate--tRNA ligase family protein [Actinomycetes bacterium]